jgi:tRNA-uridine 2-sulfurtransferase
MRVLVAMSGGVDSSVAAALLVEAGHDVMGVTLKLWDGPSDSGCCSVADVEDARRVAQQLGVTHHVFNLTDEFDERVVQPYVSAHAGGRTPNPCIECNRHIKFGRLLERARRLGFDALATGHHARVTVAASDGTSRIGPPQLRRGRDRAKDQSYVLSVLGADELGRIVLPVGELTKAQVRVRAAQLGLRTATKPDSQQVCFIHSSSGRRGFLASRIDLHAAEIVDVTDGTVVGAVDALELMTVGQRRGLGSSGIRRYVVAVDAAQRRVAVEPSAPMSKQVRVGAPTWTGCPLVHGARVWAQTSAHGAPARATWCENAVLYDEPRRSVAPGQTVALYDVDDPEVVIGSALAR